MSATGTAYIRQLNAEREDLVVRLRDVQPASIVPAGILAEAADEIERLRGLFAALRAVVDLEQLRRG